MKNRIYNLDILKFVCAVFVVFLHRKFPGEIGNIVCAISRVCVPVFFITSGYFSFQFSDDTKDYTDKLWKRCRYLLRVFVVSFVIYITFYFPTDTQRFTAEFKCLFTSIKPILQIVFLNNPISSACFHLWYLLALVYCYAILVICTKTKTTKLFYALPLLVIPALVIINNTDNYMLYRNFLFFGLPFFAAGLIIRENEEKIKKLKTAIPTLAAFFGLAVLFAEYNLISKTNELYIGNIIISVSLFVLCLNAKQCRKPRLPIGQSIIYIYVFHVLIGAVLNTLNERIIHIDDTVNSYLNPILTVIVSVTVAFILAYAKQYTIKKRKSD